MKPTRTSEIPPRSQSLESPIRRAKSVVERTETMIPKLDANIHAILKLKPPVLQTEVNAQTDKRVVKLVFNTENIPPQIDKRLRAACHRLMTRLENITEGLLGPWQPQTLELSRLRKKMEQSPQPINVLVRALDGQPSGRVGPIGIIQRVASGQSDQIFRIQPVANRRFLSTAGVQNLTLKWHAADDGFVLFETFSRRKLDHNVKEFPLDIVPIWPQVRYPEPITQTLLEACGVISIFLDKL